MWKNTEISRRLNIEYPLIQGPFGGGLSAVKLAVAVSEAGGLGSFGVHHLNAEQIHRVGAELHAQTRKPFALNLWVSNHDANGHTLEQEKFRKAIDLYTPYYEQLGIAPPESPATYGNRFEDQMQAVLEVKPAVFSFVYGIPPKEVLDECRRRGIVTAGTITTVDEAVAMEQAGVDVIVATGLEAGGHRVSFLRSPEESLTGTFALIPTVVAKVKTPVIAAGGIANGRCIAAAFMLGAQGVQVGTAFLACEESNASPVHRDALFSDQAKYTVLTRAFTGRLARGIRNRFTDDMQSRSGDILPYPIQSFFTGSFKQAAIKQHRGDLISLWASQSTALLRHRNARDLFNELVTDASRMLAGQSSASAIA
jgi:nitronate monooxygenase